MKLITKDVDYAVQAISYIAKSKKDIVSATELIDTLRIPRPFLRKILQTLNKHGILTSHKGKGGGFTLGIQVKKISLMYLIEIFRGNIELTNCIFKKQVCSDMATCLLRKKIKNIEQVVLSELNDVMIASLIEGHQ